MALNVFVPDSFGFVSMVHSNLYEVWVRKYASTLETRLRYTLADCFETFPFCENTPLLEKGGKSFYDFREQTMHNNQEGLTKIYNRFHNPKEKSTNFVRLRELQGEVDNAVAAAYGWSDLDLGHGFHETPQGVRFTISETARREVLARLLQLNHERYEEEVRQGLHEKSKPSPRPSPAGRGRQSADAAPEKPAASRRARRITKEQPTLPYAGEPGVPEEMGTRTLVHPTPMAEIGSWDRCKCLACGKTVMGFSIAEHTQSEHQGKDPGYRKI